MTTTASLAPLGGVAPLRGDSALGFISFSFVGMFGAWGGALERGFASLKSDEPVGQYPTLTTTPRTKPLTPKERATDETPTTKNPPLRDGKGVID